MIVTLGAVGTKARAVRADAIAVAILALAELDVINPNASDEVEFVTRDINVGTLVSLNWDERNCEIRDTYRRFGLEGDVEEPFHWRKRGRAVERHPHWAAPDLERWFDWPGRDPLDEDGTRMSARCRSWPATRKAKQDGAIDLVTLGRSRARQACRKRYPKGCK
jgi:hypothetical protein